MKQQIMRRIISMSGTSLVLTCSLFAAQPIQTGELLPTGVRITPTAAAGSTFQPLNPNLPTRPEFVAGQAVTTATSPDGQALLILTSGYNRNFRPATGIPIATESTEYVFVYDISSNIPVKKQVLQVPNAFSGLAWNSSGNEFYVSGGVDDSVIVFARNGAAWAQSGSPIRLGHSNGLGLQNKPMAAGVAVSRAGDRLLVANFSNDSVSLIDLVTRAVIGELDLRPGKSSSSQSGVPGGEYPYWIAFDGNAKAYVSSERDREIVVVSTTPALSVLRRIHLPGQPSRMIVNRAQDRLFVAMSNTDSVAVIDTTSDHVIRQIATTAPKSVFANESRLRGANPNSLALSPDEKTLFVTNGGLNSVAVIRNEGDGEDRGEQEEAGDNGVVGLIPTGWYPNSVSLSRDGSTLYVVNGKSLSGPNPKGCRDTTSIAPGSQNPCRGANEYMWQLTKAGFLTMPLPGGAELARLTQQVAANNGFRDDEKGASDDAVMQFLHDKIKHVIYVVKENRTFDQVLGELGRGNGDPRLAVLPERITPNHHKLARTFVTLDNFRDSGEVSGDGWNWTTAARTTDFTEKTVPVNYGGRGLTYDWEGTNRNINVAYPTTADRKAANAYTPSDPDLLPGTSDAAELDASNGAQGQGYLWDAALRAGISVRNYGFYLDLARYSLPESDPQFIPIFKEPWKATDAQGRPIRQAYPTKPSLMNITDPFYRGYDQKNADSLLFKEWEREFDAFAANGQLPKLEFVRFAHDHFGEFAAAKFGVNTVETQMADNDYALGRLVEKISHSRYKDDTMIFVVEDDAQNGPDHVDAHRSIAFVIGPYVKQGAVVSREYNTVSMYRTMEEILGLQPSGLFDGLIAPMSDVFDRTANNVSYSAIVPDPLRSTALDLPPGTSANTLARQPASNDSICPRDAEYWERAMEGQDFSVEDHLDVERFNRALWTGLMGDVPYPKTGDGRDLSTDKR